MTKIKQRTIGNTNCTVSELGLGCASLAGVGTSVPDDHARGTLAAALEAGIRYFDTAPLHGYGRSERLVGDGLLDHGDWDCFLLAGRYTLLAQPALESLFPVPAAALQFTLSHPVVSSVIPGPRTPQELNDLFSWYTATIAPELWSDLKSEGLLDENAPV